MKHSDYIEVAVRAALRAGQRTEDMRLSGSQKVTWKCANDMRTSIDEKCESILTAMLPQQSDVWQVLAEEYSSSFSDIDLTVPYWVIDPIDGTRCLMRNESYGILIGLAQQLVPHIGVMYFPMDKRLFVGDGDRSHCYEVGDHIAAGAGRLEKPITLLRPDRIHHAFIGLETGNRPHASIPLVSLLYDTKVSALFTHCSTSRQIADLLTGKLHAYIGVAQQPWDLAAPVPICLAAGLRVSTHTGEPWTLDRSDILISLPDMHGALLTLTSEAYVPPEEP